MGQGAGERAQAEPEGAGPEEDEARPLAALLPRLCGSAGSGKSTTLRTILQHLRLLFQDEGVLATVELTAYTGVAAFNIGFGAKTACSAFRIFPNATFSKELKGDQFRAIVDI